jgi:DNA repair exonuclease SbcCD ATPase subunit
LTFEEILPLTSFLFLIFSVQRDVVSDLKRQLNDLEQEMVSARSRAEACKQAYLRHGRREKELQISMQRKEDHVEELRDALDKENAEDGRIDALYSALKEAEDEKQLNEGSYKDSETAMAAIMQTLKEIRRELSSKDSELGTLQQKLRVAESEHTLVNSKKSKVLSDKNAAIANIEKDKQERATIHGKREQVAARIVEYNEKASLVSSRVSVDEGETAESLDRKLDRLIRDLERYSSEYVFSPCASCFVVIWSNYQNSRLGASREEIAAEAGRTEAAYLRATKQVQELSTLAQVSSIVLFTVLEFGLALTSCYRSSKTLLVTVRSGGKSSGPTFRLEPKLNSPTYSVSEASVVGFWLIIVRNGWICK